MAPVHEMVEAAILTDSFLQQWTHVQNICTIWQSAILLNKLSRGTADVFFKRLGEVVDV